MERLTQHFGGWVRWQGSDFPHTVLVRLVDDDGRLVVSELYVSGHGQRVDARTFRRVPIGRIETWVNQPDTAAQVRYKMGFPPTDVQAVKRARPLKGGAASPDLYLEVPDTFRYEDSFYARVAEVYTAAGQFYAAPAREIADENGVPLATVQRWVKEARRRGVLGPGRPRKET